MCARRQTQLGVHRVQVRVSGGVSVESTVEAAAEIDHVLMG
jgi:hypothetical protein